MSGVRWVKEGRCEVGQGGIRVLVPSNWGKLFSTVRVGQVLCSQVLLLPLGVPSMPVPACLTQSLSQDSENRRVLTSTGVGM